MRIYRGRVMHAVEPFRGMSGWLASVCSTRGLTGSRMPRACGPAEDWSAERYEYPDCQHCPPAEEREVHASHDPEPDGERVYAGGHACRRCCRFVTVGTPPRVTDGGAAPCRPAKITLRTREVPA